MERQFVNAKKTASALAPQHARPEAPVPQSAKAPIQQQTALSRPSTDLSRTQIMQLQNMVGNRAVTQLMRQHTQAEATVQKKENRTGLPDHLKSGLEQMSGMDMSDVQVHYNSEKPAQLSALAYAQGTDIHVAPGEEQHLAHESWHVVQQKQGRVQATGEVGGVALNDSAELEREADRMGARANSLTRQ